MSRDTRLTLWPEQTAYYPLLTSWTDIKNKTVLDFSECLGVHSCGLASTLLMTLFIFKVIPKHEVIKEVNLIKLQDNEPNLFSNFNIDNEVDTSTKLESNIQQKIKTIVRNKNDNLMQDCIALNFFSLIKDFLNEDCQREYCRESNLNSKPIKNNYFHLNTESYPLYRFNFIDQKKDRRDSLLSFCKHWTPIFRQLSTNYAFNWNQVLSILYEIAKNSADHTDDDAYMGIDIIKSKESAKICCIIGDLGAGIYEGIRNSLIEENPLRKGKTGFSEAYRAALKKGFTTKKNKKRNKGFGMSFIVNNSIAVGANTSIFDVKSRLILSSLEPISKREPPHNEIWRISHRMDGKKPFFYYLQYEAPLK